MVLVESTSDDLGGLLIASQVKAMVFLRNPCTRDTVDGLDE